MGANFSGGTLAPNPKMKARQAGFIHENKLLESLLCNGAVLNLDKRKEGWAAENQPLGSS